MRGSASGDALASLKSSAEGEFIGVFQVATHRKAAGDTGDGHSERLYEPAKYMAVASPSMLGLVQQMTSVTLSSSMRVSNSLTRSWSGPMPSMGLMAPPST